MDRKILETIQEVFRSKGLTLSASESCTGGIISHYLTCLPGSSAFFEAGVVTYSAESKITILGLSAETISKYGVVSEETAREMAEKMRLLSKADCSVATTGNLGPDVIEGKEKGLVYIAVSMKGQIFSKEIRLTGNREENRERAAVLALEFLIEIVKNNSMGMEKA